jgi:anti-sigma regulatory factor (Ser/Thr protein kinase)
MPDEWPVFSHLGPLGALPTVPRVGRRYARVVLGQWGLSDLSDTAELIISELATNAVAASTSSDGRPLYEGGRLAVIHLRLLSDRVRLLIEVWDSLPELLGAPVPRQSGEYDESGRGLTIVESASERWGWRRVPGWTGKVTWALLRQLRREHQTPGPLAACWDGGFSQVPASS